MDAADLLTAVTTGNFSRLEGVSEGAAIDFNGEPYRYEDAAITAWIPSERI